VIALLAKRYEESGSQKAFAEANDVSAQYVSDVLKQKREPGEAILKALGLYKVESYRMMAVVRLHRRTGKIELKLANAPWGSIAAQG
jgi:transcriptional regulator with XRE-family HTH domain